MTAFKQELENWRPRSSAIKTLLQRWRDDDRAEDIWRKVAKAAGANLTPSEFIHLVARTAMAARALPARIKRQKLETAATRAGLGAQIFEAFASDKSNLELAEILEEAAWQLRFREQFTMLDNYPQGARSRSQTSQSRRAFSLALSDFFKERCNKWMDNEAGVLLEIAFGPQGDDISQEVRDYRRRRQKVGD
ncbi:hypothetical protein [Bradyrhizobium sp. SZCCHNS2015]|uniref:hypothetical protein n=1 Tax=Bradyrhizobium sp. SZCCHNS2015 TaxID=3057305 RepID=UPI0028E67F63|nr:hypothetical protein [Bradyrhizobium sp. SZCCHNS2015]